MIKKVSAICLLLITLPHVMGIRSADASSGDPQIQTYQHDQRRYLTGNHPSGAMHEKKWSDWPYNLIVKICDSVSCATGTFVSPVHILTNKHVAECCGVGGTPECLVYPQYEKDVYTLAATVIAGGGTAANVKNHCKFKNADLYNGNDWAIIELTSPSAVSKLNTYFQKVSGHNKNYVDWYKPLNWWEYNGSLSVSFRAGFGNLRVLSDQDIYNIKAAYTKGLSDEAAKKIWSGEESIYMWQAPYDITDVRNDAPEIRQGALNIFGAFLNEYEKITRKNFLDDCLSDNELKIMENCLLYSVDGYDDQGNKWHGTYDEHICGSWPGDSGSALIKYKGYPQIISLNNSGHSPIPGSKIADHLYGSVPIDQIFTQEVQDMLKFTRKNNKKAGDPCEPFHLKQVNATAGYYITDGSNHLYCANLTPCSCAATECMKGFVMAKDDGGRSMGYCVWNSGATSTAANQTINTNAVASNSTSNTAAPALIAAGSTAAVVAATIAGTIADGKNTARRAYSQQTSIAANGTTAQNIVATPQNNARAIGANCAADDMPANAERGEYAPVSIKKLDCGGQQCACVATKCKNGYKLVHKQINGKWESMGYCINPKPCTTGQHDTDVIDGIEIIRQHGGKFCK